MWAREQEKRICARRAIFTHDSQDFHSSIRAQIRLYFREKFHAAFARDGTESFGIHAGAYRIKKAFKRIVIKEAAKVAL